MTDIPMTEIQLERRYRQLLSCYPAEHRREYGEEMIGVLLAATPPGQSRPSLADTLSMFGGGLRVRLRGLVTGSPDPGWSNALALTTLIAPVLLAILTWQQITRIGLTGFPAPTSVSRLIAAGVLLIPVALGLLNLRRLAAIAATGTLIWAVAISVGSGLITYPTESAFLVLLAVQAFALAVSPGPAHALTLITPRNLVLTVPWLLTAAYLARVIPPHYPVPLIVAEIGIGLVASAGSPALANPGGRRLFLIIVAIPLSALVSTILTSIGVQSYELSPSAQLAALYLPPVALASLTYLVARRGPAQPQAGVAG
jgi:hypothetical protein